MNRLLFVTIIIFLFKTATSQLVEVHADYTGDGDCIFSAYNNSKTPMFLNIEFADLQNSSFEEPLPYIKELEPGFNNLFTLERMGTEVPRFNYRLKTFRSNPFSIVDLDFPYLIPLEPGTTVHPVEVKSIAGFRGDKEPKSWNATGFSASPGDNVYAVRTGTVVEIAGSLKGGDPKQWYNTWNNEITVLQPDGTLLCYKNIAAKEMKLNEKIYAGEVIGTIAPGTKSLIVLIYQNSINSDDLRFIIPQFVTGENETGILNVAKEYTVVHPVKVRGLEMSKKERRKILKVKR